MNLIIAQIPGFDHFFIDLDTVITALLHDTVEDCDVTLSALEEGFGSSVAQLVDGVTKLSKLDLKFGFAQAENFRKLLLASSDAVSYTHLTLPTKA